MKNLIKKHKQKLAIIILTILLFSLIVIRNLIKFEHIDIMIYIIFSTIFLLIALVCKKKSRTFYFEICNFVSIVGYVTSIHRLIKLFN